MKDKLTRKEFLERISMVFVGIFGATTLLSSCSKKEETPAETPQMTQTPKQADPCSDLSGLTQDEINIRTTFQYVPHSTMPDKDCANCNFWIAPEEGKPCGACQIIKGPINPKGYCTQWLKKQVQG